MYKMFLEDALLGFTAFFSIVEWPVINFGRQCLLSKMFSTHVLTRDEIIPRRRKKIGSLIPLGRF
jgi:hypothetical protein